MIWTLQQNVLNTLWWLHFSSALCSACFLMSKIWWKPRRRRQAGLSYWEDPDPARVSVKHFSVCTFPPYTSPHADSSSRDLDQKVPKGKETHSAQVVIVITWGELTGRWVISHFGKQNTGILIRKLVRMKTGVGANASISCFCLCSMLLCFQVQHFHFLLGNYPPNFEVHVVG